MLEKIHIPGNLCPDLLKEELKDKSFLKVLEEKYRIHVKFVKDNLISILPATENEASILGVKSKFPLLRVERISYLENGEEVAYTEMSCRTDKLYLFLTVVRERQKAYGKAFFG